MLDVAVETRVGRCIHIGGGVQVGEIFQECRVSVEEAFVFWMFD